MRTNRSSNFCQAILTFVGSWSVRWRVARITREVGTLLEKIRCSGRDRGEVSNRHSLPAMGRPPRGNPEALVGENLLPE